MIFISGIMSDQIDDVWSDCEKYIELGNSKSQEEMSVQDIYENCKDKDMQLWIVFNEDKEIEAVLTTQVIDYPQKRVCRIVTLGGLNMDDWTDMVLSTLEEWAEQQSCHAMETVCRKGFIKKLKSFGYENTYTILGKELTTKH
jgi:hypothetical protein